MTQVPFELDDSLAEAHASLSFSLIWFDWNWVAAEAQAGKIYRIGAVSGGSSFAEGSQLLMALRQGLRDVGYVEGQNLFLERRNAEGRYDRFPEFIDELVRLGVDVILVGGPAGARAAQLATTTIDGVSLQGKSKP